MLEIIATLTVALSSIMIMVISVKFNESIGWMIIFIIVGVINILTICSSNILFEENMILRIMCALILGVWLLTIMVNAIKLEKLIGRKKKNK